jgi:hypothetical protein
MRDHGANCEGRSVSQTATSRGDQSRGRRRRADHLPSKGGPSPLRASGNLSRPVSTVAA